MHTVPALDPAFCCGSPRLWLYSQWSQIVWLLTPHWTLHSWHVLQVKSVRDFIWSSLILDTQLHFSNSFSQTVASTPYTIYMYIYIISYLVCTWPELCVCTCMSPVFPDHIAWGHIPQYDSLVHATGAQLAVVTWRLGIQYLISMATVGLDWCSCVGVPELKGFVTSTCQTVVPIPCKYITNQK